MKYPCHAVASSNSHILVGFSNHIQVFPLKSTSTSSPSIRKNVHKGLVQHINIAPSSELVVTTGEDKMLHLWRLPDLTLVSSRSLGKKASTIVFTPDEKTLVVGDKFGDVWSFDVSELLSKPSTSISTIKKKPVTSADFSKTDDGTGKAESKTKTSHGNEADENEEDDMKYMEPSLGHVSLVTSISFFEDGKKVITADRDEHIRISHWPNAYNIDNFLLGHKKFVASLLIPWNGCLISAGGENTAYVWNLNNYQLEREISIEALQNHIIVPFFKPKSTVPQDSQNKDIVKTLAVNKMVLVRNSNEEEEIVLFSSSGSSAILAVNSSVIKGKSSAGADSSTVLDFGHPILDICSIFKQKQVIVTLDCSISEKTTQMTNRKQFRQLCIGDDGSLVDMTDDETALVKILNDSASIEVEEENPTPLATFLYSAMYFYPKEPVESHFGKENGKKDKAEQERDDEDGEKEAKKMKTSDE